MIVRNKQALLQFLLTHFPAIGLLGARQVGKTTLAKMLVEELDAVYLDLEHPRDLAKINDPVLFFDDHKSTCIILDEIQQEPSLFKVLRSVIDEDRRPGRFILLGSASPELIRDASESLAGRIAYVELSTLNMLELGAVKPDELWIGGGYPQIFTRSDINFRNYWYLNYIKTYIERDLPQLGLNVDRQLLMRLFQMMAHIHGDILNMNNLSKSLGVSSVSIKKYLSFLEQAFLIRQLQPYHKNLKKRLVKSPKLFIRDSGLFHYLHQLNDKTQLYGHPKLGSSWEGFVIEQIIQVLPEKYNCYFYRTHDGAEIDLLITYSQHPIMSIEVKYTASPKLTKGNTIAMEDLNSEFNFIITPDGEDYMINKKVRTCNLSRFLSNYLPA